MMILETSWEVCNKMGGIYTVLSSRANQMMLRHQGEVVFIGPLLPSDRLPHDFIPKTPRLLKAWSKDVATRLPHLPIRVGQWNVPGQPAVVLVDFAALWQEKNSIYYQMWETYGLQSDRAYGDYDESCLFAVAAAILMQDIYNFLGQRESIAIFNEWQTAMGLLWLKRELPQLPTLFITHATTIGRSIAGNGKDLYAYMTHYNGDQMAQELNVEAKHGIEKKAAHQATIFATVSEITARESTQLLERTPVVLPNGFEGDFVPKGNAFTKARKEARKQLTQVASILTGQEIGDEAMFVSLGGRYEYRNKGIDLFVDSIAKVRSIHDGDRPIVAFLLVPAWVAEPRGDLRYLIEHPEEHNQAPLQHPTLTHWLHNMETDNAQRHLIHLGLDRSWGKVHFVFVPCYLHGEDGIFNRSYYELLIGMDLTVYPSYYEPWGYTPLESVAFGVPTITTNLAGFGLWAREAQPLPKSAQERQAVVVVERTDENFEQVSDEIASYIERMSQRTGKEEQVDRRRAKALAEEADWAHFYRHYEEAYRQALGQ